ncbi:hypothetical protein CPB97_001283 [Podila verticillata]|nr:hypothetical protein CPB97_001283 [Podila verticillata]
MLLSRVSCHSYDQFPDLTGKCALVTGANIGIGYATTVALVAHGAHVTMACRSESKALEAIGQFYKDVAKRYPHSKATSLINRGARL